MEHTNVKIENPDSSGIGEIAVKGPNVMLGYYKDIEQTKSVIKDGWFYTGDLGYLDKDGFLFITGRKKDLIVLKNGKKVFPEEIEILVNRLDEVEEAFVYGLPDKDDKNNVKIAVKIVYNKEAVKRKHSEMSEKELEEYLWSKIKDINKTLPMYKYIKHITITDEPLIKTTTNKIKRKEELDKILEKEVTYG